MGEKILAKLKEIWEKIVAWWKGYNSKQKTTVVVIAAAVVMAFVILYVVLTSPNYTLLEQCADTKYASQITAVLESENIPYRISDDGLRIQVPQKSLAKAKLSLAAGGIAVSAYSIDDALSGGFTTTESDKQARKKYFYEQQYANDVLVYFSAIKSAKVVLSLPENDGTLLSKDEQPGAFITLEIDGDFTNENAAFIAKAIATSLGCKNTDTIVILDREGNLLFSGEDDNTGVGTASSQLGVVKEAETLVNNDVKKVLSGTGEFGDVRVSASLVIDFSTKEITDHGYTPAEGQSQGLLGEERTYTSESEGGNGGTPGTDSNTENTYLYQDNSFQSATIEELYRKYLPNEHIEYTQIPPGTVNYAASSLAVSSTKYIVIKEEDVKAQGLLAGISWDEYKAANSERREVPVTESMIELASNASGIPASKISIVAFEENFFVDKEGLNIDIYDVIQIVLIVLILGLLALVVAKSMKGEKVAEEADELSVDSLLQSNPEPQLDDINVEEVSETRKLIEKFVDENPEAAANLLRNWLDEDWG